MASITITQVQLMQSIDPMGVPTGFYWSSDSAALMDINANQIAGVSYVWDNIANVYVSGIVQIYLTAIFQNIYSSNSYESIISYMNPEI
jgi:pyridoxine/pyridoxamine 5'-phosphate oxidase